MVAIVQYLYVRSQLYDDRVQGDNEIMVVKMIEYVVMVDGGMVCD